MHMKHKEGDAHPTPTVPVRILMQDPKGLTGKDDKEANLLGAKGESLLEIALESGVNIEHACGGVAACSTCHVYILQGSAALIAGWRRLLIQDGYLSSRLFIVSSQ